MTVIAGGGLNDSNRWWWRDRSYPGGRQLKILKATYD